jgi:sulfoxide reductase heme-binding subunit YedZ
VWLYFQALHDQLGADPVKAVIHYTGIGALNLLLLTLMVSTLAKSLKQGWLLQVRRLLGLYSFTYACLHLCNFIVLDLQLAWGLLLSEIVQRPYITIGMLAFIILSLLAITSIHWLRRAMGKRWQQLHNLSYLALLLIVVHFYWSVKSEIIEPSIYIALSVLVLLLKKNKIKRWFRKSK